MIIALFTFLFSIYLFFGLYILSLDSKKDINRIFFIISICFAFASLTSIIMQTNVSDRIIQICYILGPVSFNFVWYFILVFQIKFTRIYKLSLFAYIILAIPTIYLTFLFLYFAYIHEIFPVDFFIKNNIRYSARYPDSLNNIIVQLSLINFCYLALSCIILIKAHNKSSSNKFRKLIIIILSTQVISVVLSFLDSAILYTWTDVLDSRIPGVVLIYTLIWVSGIWISLKKYRFMAITPAYLNNEIIVNIDESLVLLSPELKIIALNNKTKELIQPKTQYLNLHFSFLIHEYQRIETELENLKKRKNSDFSCLLNYINSEGELIEMEAKTKLLEDEFMDIVGYLIIAREVKDVKHLRNGYKLSRRECNVIQYILAGKSNQSIADELFISERTVKAHITNIFNKLGVENRVQLVVLLKDFNLIPQKSADKIVFINN